MDEVERRWPGRMVDVFVFMLFRQCSSVEEVCSKARVCLMALGYASFFRLVRRQDGLARRLIQTWLSAIVLSAGAVVLAFPASVSAAAPPNDHCAGAELIPPAGPFPYWTSTNNIAEATATEDDPYYPSCGFAGLGRTVWFTFTPLNSAKFTFTTCSEDVTATTVYDTLIAIYTSGGGCAGQNLRV